MILGSPDLVLHFTGNPTNQESTENISRIGHRLTVSVSRATPAESSRPRTMRRREISSCRGRTMRKRFSLRKPTRSQERTRKKRRGLAAAEMTGGRDGAWGREKKRCRATAFETTGGWAGAGGVGYVEIRRVELRRSCLRSSCRAKARRYMRGGMTGWGDLQG